MISTLFTALRQAGADLKSRMSAYTFARCWRNTIERDAVWALGNCEPISAMTAKTKTTTPMMLATITIAVFMRPPLPRVLWRRAPARPDRSALLCDRQVLTSSRAGVRARDPRRRFPTSLLRHDQSNESHAAACH